MSTSPCNIPATNFSECNPQVKMGEIQKIYIAPISSEPFEDWTDTQEWETRLTSGEIRQLIVSGSIDAPDWELIEISNDRMVTAPATIRLNFIIDDNSDENYDFMLWTSSNVLVKMWYATRQNMYGGNIGVKAKITAKEVIEYGKSTIIKIEGFVSWISNSLPVRTTNPLAESDIYNTGDDTPTDPTEPTDPTDPTEPTEPCDNVLYATVTPESFYIGDIEYVGYLKDVAGSISPANISCDNEIIGLYTEVIPISPLGEETTLLLRNPIYSYSPYYNPISFEMHWKQNRFLNGVSFVSDFFTGFKIPAINNDGGKKLLSYPVYGVSFDGLFTDESYNFINNSFMFKILTSTERWLLDDMPDYYQNEIPPPGSWSISTKDVTVGELTINEETFYGFADGLPVGDGGTYGAISSTEFAPTTQIKGVIMNESNNKVFIYLNEENTWLDNFSNSDVCFRIKWTDSVRDRSVYLYKESNSVTSFTTGTYLGFTVTDLEPSIPPFRDAVVGDTVTVQIDYWFYPFMLE